MRIITAHSQCLRRVYAAYRIKTDFLGARGFPLLLFKVCEGKEKTINAFTKQILLGINNHDFKKVYYLVRNIHRTNFDKSMLPVAEINEKK